MPKNKPLSWNEINNPEVALSQLNMPEPIPAHKSTSWETINTPIDIKAISEASKANNFAKPNIQSSGLTLNNDNKIVEAKRSREIDPVTGKILEVLLAPAFNTVNGIRGAADTIEKGSKEILAATNSDPLLTGGQEYLQGITTVGLGLAQAGISAATPFVPAIAGFGVGAKALNEVISEKDTRYVTNPLRTMVDPQSGLGQNLADIGDLAIQLAIAKAGAKGLNLGTSNILNKFAEKIGAEPAKVINTETAPILEQIKQPDIPAIDPLDQFIPQSKGNVPVAIENQMSQLKESPPIDISQSKNVFHSWLESQPDVTVVNKQNLGKTGKGERIGAFTQKTKEGFKVTVADYSPETSYAKEIGRVLANKATPQELTSFSKEYNNLGTTNSVKPDNFANAVKLVLTTEDARLKAPELTKYLADKGVPFTDISQNPNGTAWSMTVKTDYQTKLTRPTKFGESPIKGTSHYNSMSKITDDAGLNEYLKEFTDSDKPRGVMTKDVVDDLASQLNITAKSVLQIKKGQVKNVEQLRAIKQVVADNLMEMDKFRKDNPGPLTQETAIQLKKMYLLHTAMMGKVKGLATEAGRALQEMNNPVSAREFDVLTEMKRDLEDAGQPVENALNGMTSIEKRNRYVTEILNLPRALMTSFDASTILRQNKLLLLANPKAIKENYIQSYKAMFNEKSFLEYEQSLKDRPNADLYEKTELFLTSRDNLITRSGSVDETFYGNQLAEKIPVLGKGVKASERQAVTFSNGMRADLFDMYEARFKANGKTYDSNPKLYDDMAWMVNKFSMRGDLGTWERKAGFLNSIFFSARNQTAKFQLLAAAVSGKKIFDPISKAPKEYYKLDPIVRKEIMKTAAKDIALNIGILTATSALGAEVELNPLSSDFLKVKVGKARYDIWAGWQQYMVGLAQLSIDKQKSLATGRIIKSDNFPFTSRAEKGLTMVRKKLSPVPGIIADVLYGTDLGGNEATFTNEVSKLSPMVLSDFHSALNEQGVLGTLSGFYSIHGGGFSVYNPKQKVGKGGIKW